MPVSTFPLQILNKRKLIDNVHFLLHLTAPAGVRGKAARAALHNKPVFADNKNVFVCEVKLIFIEIEIIFEIKYEAITFNKYYPDGRIKS